MSERIVKPLDWAKHPTAEAWRCETPFGTYQVWVGSLRTAWQFDSFSSLEDRRNEPANGPEAAKAAAQADYEQRILSALSPSLASLQEENEALKARVAALGAVLKPFSDMALRWDGIPPRKYFGDTDFELFHPDSTEVTLPIKLLRAARAALQGGQGNG